MEERFHQNSLRQTMYGDETPTERQALKLVSKKIAKSTQLSSARADAESHRPSQPSTFSGLPERTLR